MPDLFGYAYESKCGTGFRVSWTLDDEMRELFPEIENRTSIYRDADRWLYETPKSRWPKKNWRRFMTTWLKREKKRVLREWAKDAELRRELMVG